jgi:hypothetical protein
MSTLGEERANKPFQLQLGYPHLGSTYQTIKSLIIDGEGSQNWKCSSNTNWTDESKLGDVKDSSLSN